jgi:hypothetical protein
MQFDFLVPGLFDAPRSRRISEAAPALAKLIARGASTTEIPTSMEEWLARRMGLVADKADFPFAALASRGESMTNVSAKYWLRADPVHLSVNRDRVVLLDASQLDITIAESSALIAALQAQFKSDGLICHDPHPQRWYIASDSPIALRTQPVSKVRGHSVADFWFDGADRALWQARLSEMQMLLHAHPVNEAREAADQLPINGVWLWGAGEFPSSGKQTYAQIVASDALSAGFAALNAAQHTQSSQFRWSDISSTEGRRALVVIDSLSAFAAYGERDAWCEALAELDPLWFAPALSALKTGKLRGITIYDPGTTIKTSRIDLLKFWRRSL